MIKLENKLLSLIQALKIKLSEELQDYKVKLSLEIKRLQDSVKREGLQDYKGRMITRVFLEGEGESYLLSRVGT